MLRSYISGPARDSRTPRINPAMNGFRGRFSAVCFAVSFRRRHSRLQNPPLPYAPLCDAAHCRQRRSSLVSNREHFSECLQL